MPCFMAETFFWTLTPCTKFNRFTPSRNKVLPITLLHRRLHRHTVLSPGTQKPVAPYGHGQRNCFGYQLGRNILQKKKPYLLSGIRPLARLGPGFLGVLGQGFNSLHNCLQGGIVETQGRNMNVPSFNSGLLRGGSLQGRLCFLTLSSGQKILFLPLIVVFLSCPSSKELEMTYLLLGAQQDNHTCLQ